MSANILVHITHNTFPTMTHSHTFCCWWCTQGRSTTELLPQIFFYFWEAAQVWQFTVASASLHSRVTSDQIWFTTDSSCPLQYWGQHLDPLHHSPFYLFIFQVWNKISLTCPGWVWTPNHPVSASQSAGYGRTPPLLFVYYFFMFLSNQIRNKS